MQTVKNILETKEKPTNIIEPSALVIEALKKADISKFKLPDCSGK